MVRNESELIASVLCPRKPYNESTFNFFNSICNEAQLDGLLDFDPKHPKLPKDKKKKGQRLNSFAFPTDQMIAHLLMVAESKKIDKKGVEANKTRCLN